MNVAMAFFTNSVNCDFSSITFSMIHQVMSSNEEQQRDGIRLFRKALSVEPVPPIQAVLNTGIVPRFVELLSSPNTDVQIETAWALTNLATGTTQQTQELVDAGAIPALIKLLSSNNHQVADQSLWALSNIAGDNSKFRNRVLEDGGLTPLLKLIDNAWSVFLLRNASWTLSNLCRGRSPPPAIESLVPCIPYLKLLLNSFDNEIVSNACWCASYLTQTNNAWIDVIVKNDFCPKLVQLLQLQNEIIILSPALRATGNIIAGTDYHTQTMINCNVLPYLSNLLSHFHPLVRREAAWTFSNVLAGTTQQIAVVLQIDAVSKLKECLADEDLKVRKEAAWAISNALTGGSSEQVTQMANDGVLPVLVQFLNNADDRVTSAVLTSLKVAFKVGELQQSPKSFCDVMEFENSKSNVDSVDLSTNKFTANCDLEPIRKLQSHLDLDIRTKSEVIEARFFRSKYRLCAADFGLSSTNTELRIEFHKRS